MKHGSTTFVPIHDWAHTTVLTHVCAKTRLCPDTFVPSHVCAQSRLFPDTFVPRHVCAQTRLCPDTIVPRHDCVQTWLCPDTLAPQHELLWPDTIMSLVNNNIIIVSTRLIMCQLDWWKHKHAQLLLVKRNEMWLINNCSPITSSIPFEIFLYFIMVCQGTKCVSGHKRTSFCPDMIVTTRL